MSEILSNFIEAEEKTQLTAREIATQTREELEVQLRVAKAKIGKAKADIEDIAAIGARLTKAGDIEAFLLEQGAAGKSKRARLNCTRRLLLGPLLAWHIMLFVPSLLAMLLSLPSLRQLPVFFGHVGDLDLNFLLGAAGLWLAMVAIVPVVFPLVPRLQLHAALVVGAVLLALQLAVSTRIWTEDRRWSTSLPRCTTAPFARGVDARSLVLVTVVILEGLLQSAFAYVPVVSAALAAAGNVYFPWVFLSAAVVPSVYAVLLATLTLSLAATRSQWIRKRAPPLAADTGYHLPLESLMLPLLNDFGYLVVLLPLLWMLDCNVPTASGQDSSENTTAASGGGDGGGGGVGGVVYTTNAAEVGAASSYLGVHPTTECWVGQHHWLAAVAAALAVVWQLQTGLFATWLAEPR